jgi:hypothetical protein
MAEQFTYRGFTIRVSYYGAEIICAPRRFDVSFIAAVKGVVYPHDRRAREVVDEALSYADPFLNKQKGA